MLHCGLWQDRTRFLKCNNNSRPYSRSANALLSILSFPWSRNRRVVSTVSRAIDRLAEGQEIFRQLDWIALWSCMIWSSYDSSVPGLYTLELLRVEGLYMAVPTR